MDGAGQNPAERRFCVVMRLLEAGLSITIATLIVALSPYPLGLLTVVTVAPLIHQAACLME